MKDLGSIDKKTQKIKKEKKDNRRERYQMSSLSLPLALVPSLVSLALSGSLSHRSSLSPSPPLCYSERVKGGIERKK